MGGTAYPKLSPGVAWLLAANALAFLILATVLTAPGIAGSLQFSGHLGEHPWSVVTYPLTHVSLFHLAATSLVVWLFGRTVERRLGTPGFLLFYLYCGVGAALLSLLLATLGPVPPLAGALAPGLGLAVGWGFEAGDRDVHLFPLPYPARARTLVVAVVVLVAALALLFWNPVLHIAVLGGAGAGWAFIQLRSLVIRPQVPVREPVRRATLAPLRLHQDSQEPSRDLPQLESPPRDGAEDSREARSSVALETETPSPFPTAPKRPEDEVNRLLDKISAEGIASLTAQERRFLDEMSRRKRQSPEDGQTP